MSLMAAGTKPAAGACICCMNEQGARYNHTLSRPTANPAGLVVGWAGEAAEINRFSDSDERRSEQ